MAQITFLGGEETGDPAKLQWGRFTFIYGQAVECDDPHIIAKASRNRYFSVDGGGGKVAVEIEPDDPADEPGRLLIAGSEAILGPIEEYEKHLAEVFPRAAESIAKADPFDHDGDGHPGGSLPKAKRGRPRKAKDDAA